MHRRRFLKTIGTVCVPGWTFPRLSGATTGAPLARFKLGSISDEWSQNFEEALEAMKSYGLRWVEIRTLWNIYNTEATPDQLRRIKDLLERYAFRISVLDTALFKCALPGTKPVGEDKDAYPYSEQMDLLRRAMERAAALGTDKLRVFAFWRVAEPEKHVTRIADELAKAAQVARSGKMRLVLENESACNVATGHELARMMALVPAENLGANWDVGNGYWQGEDAFPAGYAALDKRRIWHMHLKDVQCMPRYKECQTAIVGTGHVDLLGQLRALLHDGYSETMSLEPEVEAPGVSHLEATRRSLEAMLAVMSKAIG